MSAREHFGIVGGGLLGLTLALRLAQRGYRVTLLEAADHVGGLADAWRLGDVTWDRHYHVTLQSDTHLRGILKELGLDKELRWAQTRTGFLVDGQLHSLSSIWDFLRFPPLGPVDKLRLGWTIWHASRVRNWRKLEQIPIGDWLMRHSGRQTFERIWLPLLKAKLGDAWRRTSAAFIWATIQRMYAARRSGAKREMFGYLPGGYARLLDAFQRRLEELGVEIRTGYRAERIESDEGGSLAVVPAGGTAVAFDRVVVTTPAPIAARLCAPLGEEETKKLNGIEYLGIVCASLLTRKPLAGFYVTNITDSAPFTGVIEMSALVDPTEFGGRTLIYLPRYATADDPTWSKSDDEIRGEFLAALARLYPGFAADDVLAFRVSRVRHVFALSTIDYSSRVPAFHTSAPGLFIVNSAQIVNGTLNVNETVRLAESSIETLCRRMQITECPRGRSPHSEPKLLATNHA
jgi:protoporphyrinogen oxidase